MAQLPISQVELVEETEATGELADLYDEIRRGTGYPFVTNLFKATGGSPRILEGLWHAYRAIAIQTTLPASLASMIGYSVSAANHCTYCNTLHKMACQQLGIDDDTMAALNSDFKALAPERVQEIITFAVKVGTDPASLTEDDYERVRAQGVSEDELLDIIATAAWATFADRLADSMKIEVDSVFTQAA